MTRDPSHRSSQRPGALLFLAAFPLAALSWGQPSSAPHSGTPGPVAGAQTARAQLDELPAGSGSYQRSQRPCLTHSQREQIQTAISANQRQLIAGGALPRDPQLLVRFDWPLKAVGSAAEGSGVHAIVNFVDQDASFPGNLLDYNCGTRSYDLPGGYNHRGIDIITWPFAWRWMDADEVQIVAAAAGTIVLKSDGNFDENCGFGGGNWNAVYVQHGDGSVAWYGHMKSGSLTTKLVGDSVAAGEYLGVIGSSGSSTNPHLHLEVYDRHNQLVEPFAGPCNTMNANSWWREQPPYYDSAINRLVIGNAPVSFPPCPGRAIINEAASVPRGTTAFLTAFYRDQLSTQTSQYRIRRPNGTVFSSWSHAGPAPHYAASWWYWARTIPAGAPTGSWTFEVSFAGQIYSRTFVVS